VRGEWVGGREGKGREQGVGHSFRRMRGIAVDRRIIQKVDSFVFVLLGWRSHCYVGHTDLRPTKCGISSIELDFSYSRHCLHPYCVTSCGKRRSAGDQDMVEHADHVT